MAAENILRRGLEEEEPETPVSILRKGLPVNKKRKRKGEKAQEEIFDEIMAKVGHVFCISTSSDEPRGV